jgi:ankyrin repeat protein
MTEKKPAGGMQALREAILEGRAEDVRDLVGAQPTLLSMRGEDGASPMQFALYLDKMDVVSVLLEMGYRPDLFESALLGRADFVRDHLRHHPEEADSFSPDGWSLLHLAAYGGDARTVKAVLEAGAEIHALATSKYSPGNTPLHAAVAAGQANAALALIEGGADIDFPQLPGRYTPLHIAASRPDPALVGFLIQQGAEINPRAEDGSTPLAIAQSRGHKKVADLLMLHGAVT